MYHFLDQQRVSDLSHIGLLSFGITFQKLESLNVFKNAFKGRALDKFLSH